MSKPDKRRSPAVKKQVTDLSNSEIVVIAAFRVGAAGLHADTEDDSHGRNTRSRSISILLENGYGMQESVAILLGLNGMVGCSRRAERHSRVNTGEV